MTPDRVTSNVVFHVRAACGVTLDYTPDEAAARTCARENGAQMFKVDRISGVAVLVA